MTKKAERYQSKIDRVYGVEKFEIISISTKYGKDKLRCLTCNKLFLTELDEFVKNKIGCQNKTNGSCYAATLVQDKVNAVHRTDIVVLKSDGKLSTKTAFKCNTCDNQWETTLQSVLNGSGCQLCASIKRAELLQLNIPDIDARLYNIYGDKVKLKYYCGNMTKNESLFLWTTCGHIQKISLSNILYNNFYTQKTTCQDCIKLEREEKYNAIIEYLGFNMSDFTRTDHKATFTCKYCQKSFKSQYNNVISNNRRCTCKQAQTLSLGERDVRTILKALSINFVEQYQFHNYTNRFFDFFLPDYNLAIEFNGEQHYSPVNWNGKLTDEKLQENFTTQQTRDNENRLFCKENGIDLYEIKWDSENWESKLLNYLKFI